MSKYLEYKNKIELPKLRKFVKENRITREQLIRLIQRESDKKKVLKNESVDDLIKRINSEFGLDYAIFTLKKIKVKPKDKKSFSCTLIFYRRIEKTDMTPYKKTIKDPDGNRYRETYVAYADVRGDILSYNNKRTFRPIKKDTNKERLNGQT